MKSRTDSVPLRERLNAQLVMFIAGIAGIGIAGGIFETTFNNYLSDQFHLEATTRGVLEFPRELPGFLTALFAGLLCFLPETYIAAACAGIVGIGMIGLGLFGSQWMTMMTCMILWSIGVHLFMPIRSSIGMALAHKDKQGTRLGQLGGVGTAASLVGCSIVVVLLRFLKLDYRTTFITGGIIALLAAGGFAFMRLPDAHLQRKRFVWKRKYGIFYVLALLFGARKQLFITFGPWVLIKIFHQPAYIFAQLCIAVLMFIFSSMVRTDRVAG